MGAFVIPSIFSAIDKMSGPMKGIEGRFTSMADKAAVASARMERSLKRVSDKAMDISLKTGAAGLAITAPLMMAKKVADDFETQMGNVGTIVDTTKESIKDMSNQILDMANRTPVKINDLTESLYQIRSSGVGAADAMNVLDASAKLAITGLSTTTAASMAVTSAMVNFKNENLSSTEIADIFFKTVTAGKTKMEAINEAFGSNASIVAAAGVKFKEFEAATAAMTNSGQTAAEAQTAIKGATIALIKPTGEMSKALHMLGVKSGEQLIKKMGGLIPAMIAVGDVAKKHGLNINKEFGRVQGLTAYTLLTGELSEAFKKNMVAMDGANTMNQKYADRLNESNNIEQMFKNSMQSLIITIGGGLSPLLDRLTKKLGPIIRDIRDWMEAHPKLTEVIFSTALVVGSLLLAISGVSLVIGIVTKATWLFNAALWANPITWIIAGIIALIAIIVVVTKHISGWGEQWDEIVNWMKAVWEAHKQALLLSWLLIRNAFMNMVEKLASAWYWFENKVGRLSDEQYKKNIAQIESEKKARIDAINETISKMLEAGQIAANGPAMKLQWNSSEELAVDGSTVGATPAPALNPKLEEQQRAMQQSWNGETGKQMIDITLTAAPGTSAEVTKNTGGKMPTVTSTTGYQGR